MFSSVALHWNPNRYLFHSHSKPPTSGCVVVEKTEKTEWSYITFPFPSKGLTKDMVDDLAQSSVVIKAGSFAGSISARCEAARCTLWQDIEFRDCGNGPPMKTISTLGGICFSGFSLQITHCGHSGGCGKSKIRIRLYLGGGHTITQTHLRYRFNWI